MPRPTLSTAFDAVYVIESLAAPERHTGWNVYHEVLKPWAAQDSAHEARYWQARTRPALDAALGEVLARARAGRVPLLQIDAHGDDAGITLGDGTRLSWRDLRAPLTAINIATRCGLVVVSAMCYGDRLVKAMSPGEPTPVAGVIGPDHAVLDVPMEDGLWLMYQALFDGAPGDVSLAALNAEQTPAEPGGALPVFRPHSAEGLFHLVVPRFFANRTPERDRADVEAMSAALAAKWADLLDPVALASWAHERAAARIGDARYWYDTWRTRFLMLDRFPENAPRFTLTYDDYLAGRSVP